MLQNALKQYDKYYRIFSTSMAVIAAAGDKKKHRKCE